MNAKILAIRLLNLSQMICKEFDGLIDLSYHDLEHSDKFQEHIDKLESLLGQETIILNTVNKSLLVETYLCLDKMDTPIEDEAYERCHYMLDDITDELLLEDEMKKEENEEPEIDEDTADEYYDNMTEKDPETEEIRLQSFYTDEDGIEEYKNYIIERNALKAIKKMSPRISSVISTTKGESKFQKRLLKYLKVYKYYFFRLNPNLEKLGIKYRFDFTKIPDYHDKNIDLSRISYNECINLLDTLYSTSADSRNPSDISEVLYDMIRFEEHLDDLDTPYLDKLITVCDYLNELLPNSYYGKVSLNTLVRRKERK